MASSSLIRRVFPVKVNYVVEMLFFILLNSKLLF